MLNNKAKLKFFSGYLMNSFVVNQLRAQRSFGDLSPPPHMQAPESNQSFWFAVDVIVLFSLKNQDKILHKIRFYVFGLNK